MNMHNPPDLLARAADDAAEDQGGPTRAQMRAMLINGAKDFDAHFPQETPAELVDRMMSSGELEREPSTDFSWQDNAAVIVPEQLAVAVYINPDGGLVIRQKADYTRDEDDLVIIERENVEAFIDKLCDLIGIPSAGRDEGAGR